MRVTEQLTRFKDEMMNNPSHVATVIANSNQTQNDRDLPQWPELEPLGNDLLPLPPFLTEMLPEAFREHVMDIAERMQVPVDLPAVCAVASLAGVVNRRAAIQPKPADTGWVVIPNIWAGIVTPPGQMKTNVLSAFTNFLSRIEARWHIEHQSDVEDYKEWELERGLRERAWQQQFVAAVKADKPPPICPDETRLKPTLKRLIANDPTFESLHCIFVENPAGIFLVRDELSGWLAGLNRPGREGERQFVLEAWTVDQPFTVDRIGRGTIHVPALCLSILGGIQPGRLRQYLVDAIKGGPGDDGLFQCFHLLVWPDFPKAWNLIDRPVNQGAAERVGLLYERLVELFADDSLRFKLSDESQMLFFAWWTDLERKIRSGDLHPALAAHLGKFRSLMPSLALLFELADAGTSGETGEVSLIHAQQAAAWCDYLEGHARRVYGCLICAELHAARQWGDKIFQGKLPAEFSTRDVFLKGWSDFSKPDQARAASRVLEDCGWVRPAVAEKREGRPSEVWEINPKLQR